MMSRLGINNPMLGRKQSEKSRMKMSKNHVDFSGKLNPNYKMGKYLYTFIKNDKIIKTKSLTQFCNENNLNLNTLNWCFRYNKKYHKGWQLQRDLIKTLDIV